MAVGPYTNVPDLPGQITSSPKRTLDKMAVQVLKPVGVRGRRGRRR